MVAISTLNRLPESCIDCPCSYNGQYEEGLYCGVSNEEIPREVMRECRLNNCPLIEMEDKHLFNPDGTYYDATITEEKTKEVNEVITPLVKNWLDEGYSISEILHFIVGNIEFDIIMSKLVR